MQLGLSELNIRLSAKPTGKSRVAHESPTEPLQSQAVVLTTNNSATAFTIRVNRPSESTYKGKAKRAAPGVAASRAWFTVYLSLGSKYFALADSTCGRSHVLPERPRLSVWKA